MCRPRRGQRTCLLHVGEKLAMESGVGTKSALGVRTRICYVAGQSYERSCAAHQHYPTTSGMQEIWIRSRGVLVIFGPKLQHGLSGVCARQIIVSHACFDVGRTDVHDVAVLDYGASSYTVQRVWKLFGFENFSDLLFN